jgi:hypothetical protein
MSEFNEIYVILYKDENDNQIKPILNDKGGLRLFMTWTKVHKVAKEMSDKTQIEHYPHSFEINRVLFE